MRKKLELDDALMWKMLGKLDHRSKREHALCFVGCLSIVPVSFAAQWVYGPRPTWNIIIPLLVILGCLLWTVVLDMCAEMRRHRIEAKTEWYPVQFRLDAYTLYGFNYEGDLAAWECHESHLPGDCSLCGAT